MSVRVRFAPSPTGALHIGGVRTALYNYLLARQHQGTMILRIEDTDQNRYVPGAEDYIIESLKWAGIQIDEGVGVGGPHAPYRQSERKGIYAKYAQQLIDSGNAYYAFDSSEELDARRTSQPNFQYDASTRMSLNNSLVVGDEEAKKRVAAGKPYVIRLKVPAGIEVKLHDLIRGEVVVNSSQVDDKVLMKSDGMPTYHLANVVDDHLMEISHVIRGEEWLPSAPLHVLLYRFLGWESTMPRFAHLPLLLKPDGNGKLSKRDADKMGFPIFPLTWQDPFTKEVAVGYREAGYLPEAIVNFLAFLGWNPGTEQELFSMNELIEAFSVERIGKAGAKFDILKAQWFNQQYLRKKSDQELTSMLKEQLAKRGISASDDRAAKIAVLLRDRITFPGDLSAQATYFFQAPATYDEQVVSKKWNLATRAYMEKLKATLASRETTTSDQFKAAIEEAAGAANVKSGQMMQMLRVVITGVAGGPDLMVTMEILGVTEVMQRIERALNTLEAKS